MGTYASNTKLDQLTLVDGPDMAAPSAESTPSPSAPVGPELFLDTPAPVPAPVAPAPSVPQMGSTNMGETHDPFMAEALREFDAGQVEQPLWVRSLAQSGGNVAAAKPAYLRARAVALRLARRDKRGDRALDREASHRASASSPGKSSSAAPAGGSPDRKKIALAAGGLLAVVLIAGFFVMRPGSSAPEHAAGAVVPANKPAPAPRVENAKTAAAAADAAVPREDFARKVQEYKDARNWNVLVLYAAEWTRKEPDNAQAWKELGGGYLRLRQYDDALEATRKAAMKSPSDAELWQNLGIINAALHQPVAALSAFEKASELNGRDVTSRVQAGLLNIELGHLPQARDNFASALEINPLDAEALCGSVTVARKEGRTKDVEAITRQARTSGLECREPEPPAPPPTAAVNAPAGKKPAPPRGK
jgi:tetratricopeptide (TPR) repeat protein